MAHKKERIIFLLSGYNSILYHMFGYIVTSNNLKWFRETNLSSHYNVRPHTIYNFVSSGSIDLGISCYNLLPHLHFYFSDWINKIIPDVNTGDANYFWYQKGSYYDAITYVCKNITAIKLRYIMSIIDSFTTETPDVKYPWTKEHVLSIFTPTPTWQNSQEKNAIWLQENISRWYRGDNGWLALTLFTMRSQLIMVPLVMMVIIVMEMMILVWER